MEVYGWIKNSRILGAAYDKGYEDGNTEAYQQGLNDAWECVKKLFLTPSEYDGALGGTEIKSIFGTNMYNILKCATPSDVIAKIKEYEDEQKCKNCRYPLENPLCGVGNQHCDRKQKTEDKTGHWIKTIGESGVTSAVCCSECGFEDNRYTLFRYCPNCGAKMFGG